MAGVGRGAFTCVGWQVTLLDPIWQETSHSSKMGFPWAIGLYLLPFFTFLSLQRNNRKRAFTWAWRQCETFQQQRWQSSRKRRLWRRRPASTCSMTSPHTLPVPQNCWCHWYLCSRHQYSCSYRIPGQPKLLLMRNWVICVLIAMSIAQSAHQWKSIILAPGLRL